MIAALSRLEILRSQNPQAFLYQASFIESGAMDQNLDEKVGRLSLVARHVLELMLTRSLNAGFEGFGAGAPYRNLSRNGDYD